MGLIYKITSPNGRLYVGKTYDLKKRIASHKSAAKQNRDDIILRNSIRKYGWDAHVLEVIEECADELMDEREIFWIAELRTYCYDGCGGMNMTKGGDGQRTTWKHDTERVQKAKERFSGEKNPFYGKRHSQEFKDWMSEYAKERNKRDGRLVPEWGAEKGREVVRKSVVCYDVNGNLIQEYKSLTEAAKALCLNIGSVTDSLRLDTWVGGKYFFRYKNGDEIKEKIEVPPVTKKTVRRPIYALNDDLEIIFEFPSAQEASDFFGIPKTTINRAAQYNDLNPIRTGHIFCYKDEYLEEYSLVA